MKKMNMIQIGMIGVLGALLAIQFKGGKTEYGIYLSAGQYAAVCMHCRPVRAVCGDDRRNQSVYND